MKKWFVLLSLLLVASFVVAQEMPDAGVGGEDAEKLQEAIETYSPLSESGEVDFEKYKPFVTKAELRIAAINLWLEDNASWLKVVFGMVPSVTLLFVINLWFFLFFIVLLVLNSIFELIPVLRGKINLEIIEFSWAKVVGIVVFLALLFLKVFVYLANLAYGLFDVLWNYVLPWGFAIAVILLVVVAVVFLLLLRFAPQVLAGIKKKMDERKKKREEEKEALNRKVLGKIVEGITED